MHSMHGTTAGTCGEGGGKCLGNFPSCLTPSDPQQRQPASALSAAPRRPPHWVAGPPCAWHGIKMGPSAGPHAHSCPAGQHPAQGACTLPSPATNTPRQASTPRQAEDCRSDTITVRYEERHSLRAEFFPINSQPAPALTQSRARLSPSPCSSVFFWHNKNKRIKGHMIRSNKGPRCDPHPAHPSSPRPHGTCSTPPPWPGSCRSRWAAGSARPRRRSLRAGGGRGKR